MSDGQLLIQLEEIIEYMPGNVYWTDIEGNYLGCNANVIKTLRLNSSRDIIGKKIHELIADQNIADEVVKIDQNVIKYDKEIIVEQDAFNAEGKKAIYLTRKLPLHDKCGNIIGVLGISIDITERKKIEQAILIEKEKAEAANRAKTEFLANMSHDVKTPLASIHILAKNILRDEQSKRFEADIGLILSCQKQLSVFFKNCLENASFELSSSEESEEAFSIKTLLDELYALTIANALEKSLFFNIEIDSSVPPVVFGHRFILFRIILNLISNALKFTDKGGITVSVITRFVSDKDKIEAVISVKDTGRGIPEDKQSIIFERLTRLSSTFSKRIEGSGIGLYIVDEYVKRMGGRIDVKSKLGEGSLFSVTVPLKISNQRNEHVGGYA